MKTTPKSVSLSLDINEINEAITQFLETKGYKILCGISMDTIKIFVTSGELIMEAECNNKLPATEEVIFSKIFFSRIGPITTKLGMFINNVDKDQLQNFAKKVFMVIGEQERKLLSFTYSLTKNEKTNFIKAKKIAEIKKEFVDLQQPLKSLNYVLTQFAKILNNMFLDALAEKALKPNKHITKENSSEIDIKDAGFCRRTFNCLHPEEVKTIFDLLELKVTNLRKFRNLGQLGIEEIETFKLLHQI